MNHFMFDVETLGPPPKGHILSIGVQQFDPHQGKLGDKAYVVMGMKKEQPGRVVDLSTLEWWFAQSAAARGEFVNESRPATQPLLAALCSLDHWLRVRGVDEKDEDLRCWAKPPSFDIEILRDAWNAENQVHGWPFHWRCTRDLRTLTDVAKELSIELPERPEDGGQHTALADATWQAQRVIDITQALKRGWQNPREDLAHHRVTMEETDQ